jgi:hypothetical protein
MSIKLTSLANIQHELLAPVQWAMNSTYQHTTLQATSAQLAFHRDMIMLMSYMVHWQSIRQRRQQKLVVVISLPECKGIGYAHNMFGILAQPPHVVDDLINALNIKVGDKKEAIQKDPGVFCVAPWHFHPSQMIHNEHEGWWILTQNHSYMLTAGKCVFVDEDRKK